MITRPARFDELTDAQLVALTQEQIEFYVDRACAEDGVPFLPQVPPQPPKVSFTPATTLWVLEGLKFFNQEDAEKAAQFLNQFRIAKLEYVNYDYKKQVAMEDDEPFTITTIQAFTREQVDKGKQELEMNALQADEYKKAKDLYDTTYKARLAIAQPMYAAVQEARNRESRRSHLLAEFQRYLPLAENDRGIAARFLAMAHKDATAVTPELFEGNEMIEADAVLAGVANNMVPASGTEIPF